MNNLKLIKERKDIKLLVTKFYDKKKRQVGPHLLSAKLIICLKHVCLTIPWSEIGYPNCAHFADAHQFIKRRTSQVVVHKGVWSVN